MRLAFLMNILMSKIKLHVEAFPVTVAVRLYKGLQMMCMLAVLLGTLLGSSVLASNQHGKNL